jgi:hypothetical protein
VRRVDLVATNNSIDDDLITTTSEAFAIATNQQSTGQLQEAEQSCRKILDVDPNQDDAWMRLVIRNRLSMARVNDAG